jgi:hypothetical protein
MAMSKCRIKAPIALLVLGFLCGFSIYGQGPDPNQQPDGKGTTADGASLPEHTDTGTLPSPNTANEDGSDTSKQQQAGNGKKSAPAKKYKVKFCKEQGEPVIEEVDPGKTVNKLPQKPEKKGYKFVGWVTKEGDAFTNKTIVKTDMEIFEKWERQEFTVTFDADGGELAQKSDGKKTTKESTIKELPEVKKEGYELSGWFTGDTEFTSSTQVTGNMTVKAKWTPQKFTVMFDATGGEPIAEGGGTRKIEYGQPIGELPEEPTRKHWKFLGWIDDAQNNIDKNKLVTDNTTYFAKWDFDDEEVCKTITSLENRIMGLESMRLKAMLGIAFFVLVIIVLMIITLATKASKKKQQQISQKFNDFETKYGRELGMLKEPRTSSSTDVNQFLLPRVNGLEQRIQEMERGKNSIAVSSTHSPMRQESAPVTKPYPQPIQNGSVNPLVVFNAWAANPGGELPSILYYMKGEPRIRVTQQLPESTTGPTKWISNRTGSKKYLLPNPNLFDDRTDISELYKMDMGSLKPKGQNKVKAIDPCEMSDTGFINYPGKLQLL